MNTKNTFYSVLIWGAALTLVAFIVLIAASPYGKSGNFNYRLVKHTVDINASADSVFRFLGNSGNAQRWSVFVHHINTLNGDSLPDGMPGSRRRCFCKADETGTLWDETILEVMPGRKRQISCYALKGFPMTAEGIATEQLYEEQTESSCKLTFTFFVKDRTPGVFEYVKLYIGSYVLKDVFKRNLENVKAICEGKNAIHPREQ